MVLGRLLFCLALAANAVSQTRHIVVISHRGEHLRNPENTLPAFREAIRVGADFIEVDVRTTSDGKLVLMHDGTVDRRTNGQGKVSEMTFDQIEALDAGIKSGPEFAGVKVPTFDETLDVARDGKIGIYVDVKSASATDLVTHIDGHGMTDRVVIYCGPALAKQIQALNPRLKIMPEAGNVERARQIVAELRPKVMAFDAKDFQPDIIAVVKDAKTEIYVDRLGPADTAEVWQAAINAGADGIQTDRPGPLVEYLKSKGYR